MWQSETPINGDRAMLRVERVVAELRGGRMVKILHQGYPWLVTAVETALPSAIEVLARHGEKPPELVLAAARAGALGLKPRGDLALSLPPGADPDWLRCLAWVQAEPPCHEPPPRTRPAPPAAVAGLELARLARLLPAVLVAPLPAVDLPAPRGEGEDLLVVSTGDLARYPQGMVRGLHRVGEARVPLAAAERSRFVLFRSADGLSEHMAIVVAEPDFSAPVLVRLHSACFTGDLFGSLRCDCGEQLRTTVAAMNEAGGGVLLYLAQEGRDIGLANKLRAYALQDAGYDTLDANTLLGFGHDERRYDVAAEMLRQLGVLRVRLMTNNPVKLRALEAEGIAVEHRVPLIIGPNPHNEHYLSVKARRAGHLLDGGQSNSSAASKADS